MADPFKNNFRGLSDKFPTILIFHILFPRLGYFSRKKEKIKYSDLKMWRREESEKFSLSQDVKLHLKFSEK